MASGLRLMLDAYSQRRCTHIAVGDFLSISLNNIYNIYIVRRQVREHLRGRFYPSGNNINLEYIKFKNIPVSLFENQYYNLHGFNINNQEYIQICKAWLSYFDIKYRRTTTDLIIIDKINKMRILITNLYSNDIIDKMEMIKNSEGFQCIPGRRLIKKSITMTKFLNEILFSERCFNEIRTLHNGFHYFDYDVIYTFLKPTFISPADSNSASFKADVRNILQINGYINRKNIRRRSPPGECSEIESAPYTSEQSCRRNQKNINTSLLFTTSHDFNNSNRYNVNIKGLWKNISDYNGLLRNGIERF